MGSNMYDRFGSYGNLISDKIKLKFFQSAAVTVL